VTRYGRKLCVNVMRVCNCEGGGVMVYGGKL